MRPHVSTSENGVHLEWSQNPQKELYIKIKPMSNTILKVIIEDTGNEIEDEYDADHAGMIEAIAWYLYGKPGGICPTCKCVIKDGECECSTV